MTLDMYAARLARLATTRAVRGSSEARALELGAQALRTLAAIEAFAGDDALTVGRNASGRYYARLTGRAACAGDSLTDALGQLATALAWEEEARETIPAPPPSHAEAP